MAEAALAGGKGWMKVRLLVVEQALDRGQRASLGILQLRGVATEAQLRRDFIEQAYIRRRMRGVAAQAFSRGNRAMHDLVLALEVGVIMAVETQFGHRRIQQPHIVRLVGVVAERAHAGLRWLMLVRRNGLVMACAADFGLVVRQGLESMPARLDRLVAHARAGVAAFRRRVDVLLLGEIRVAGSRAGCVRIDPGYRLGEGAVLKDR